MQGLTAGQPWCAWPYQSPVAGGLQGPEERHAPGEQGENKARQLALSAPTDREPFTVCEYRLEAQYSLPYRRFEDAGADEEVDREAIDEQHDQPVGVFVQIPSEPVGASDQGGHKRRKIDSGGRQAPAEQVLGELCGLSLTQNQPA